MTLGLRKVLIVGLVAGIVLIANLLVVASWLDQVGVIKAAQATREEFLTGTATTIILALLILLVSPCFGAPNLLPRCPVCDHRTAHGTTYCSECGSCIQHYHRVELMDRPRQHKPDSLSRAVRSHRNSLQAGTGHLAVYLPRATRLNSFGFLARIWRSILGRPDCLHLDRQRQ